MVDVLIVEDEAAISDLIAMNLELAGYGYEQVADGNEAIARLHEDPLAFDLLVLDIMLPGADGLTVLKTARHYDISVILLTAKRTLSDKVMGLREGADDYITKPFEGVELLARIDAVLRRRGRSDDALSIGDVMIDYKRREVRSKDRIIDLTAKEFALLLFLAEQRNRALSREAILSRVWGTDFIGESRAVDVHIQRLRKKLDGALTISTIYKYGYRLDVSG